MPDMKILFLAYLISTLGQMLITFLYFSCIWERMWESSGGLLNFSVLSPTLPLPCCLEHLSIPVAASEGECDGEGWPADPSDGGGMEEALSPAGLGISKSLRKHSRSALNVAN